MELLGRILFTIGLSASLILLRAAIIVIRHQIACNRRERAIRQERYLSGANLTSYDRWYGHDGTKAPKEVHVVSVETLS